VVVVAFHAPELLDHCLGELGPDLDVVVVDNSSDAQVAGVASRHAASYFDPGHNLGFAGGVNLGCARRGERDVLLLNPDATITPAGVEVLHARLRAGLRVAAVAPRQHDPDHLEDARVDWPFPTPTGAWIEAVGLGRLRRAPDFLIGSVLLLSGAALDDVGGFDQDFFLYAEETDWQRRAADRGWRVAVCDGVVATHVGAGTGGDPVARETHFQASHERYVRKHHGDLGWWSYRSATLAGAWGRSLVLTGQRRRDAVLRSRLLRVGPLRAERSLDRTGLRVVHVVVTDNFAGVERYICQVANGLAARGHEVEVIGGEPDRMAAELSSSVAHRPAGTLPRATLALAAARGADVVHVHMTAAEASAFLARPVDRAPIVATRHFAADRGSSPVRRASARVVGRAIAVDVAISEFVARSVTGPTTLIPNGVVAHPQADLTSTVVVMLQRLDHEKQPDVGIRAWAHSGLADRNWKLVVAGDGVLRPDLEALVERLGCGDSVEFLGQVADTDALLAGASVLLAPCAVDAFGLSVVEAMSHGLAVVAAAGGAHVETVGDAGILFPPGDADAAGASLLQIGTDPALLHSTGAALRERQRERFSLGLHLDRLESLYRSVVAGRP